MQIKVGTLAAALLVLIISITACSGESGAALSVKVKVAAPEETVVETTVDLDENAGTAEEAIKKACQNEKKAFTLKEGMFDNFGGIASTKTDGWLLYINDTLSEVGAKDVALKDGDQVEFRYENYDEAFAK